MPPRMSTTPRKASTPGNISSKTSSGDSDSSHNGNLGTSNTNGSMPRGNPNQVRSSTGGNSGIVSSNGLSQGLGRTPSTRGSTGPGSVPVSARAAARKPGRRSNLSMSNVPRMNSFTNNNDSSDEADAARAQNAALIAELKDQLQKAEVLSDQYQKQLGVLQMRLDEAVSEQAKLEDQAHDKDSTIEALNNEIRDRVRQIRELELSQEAERAAMLREKEQHSGVEEELQSTIQRLKESLAQREARSNVESDRMNMSRSSSFRNRSSPDLDGQFAPSSVQLERSPSRSNSKLLLQKDKLIESLRLELAESQIKLVEMENQGGGRQRELERELLEARMANARLMEDNESYQLLLSERTLNGDFTKGDFMRDALPDAKESRASSSGGGGGGGHSGLGSLADELESVDERAENGDESRRLEAEIKALKDQNKALTLYIERIISRLLQHEGFEHILDRNEGDGNDKPRSSSTAIGPGSGATAMTTAATTATATALADKEKELPPTPADKEDPANSQSLLQRARSVVSGPPTRRPQALRPRPMSFAPMGPPLTPAPLSAHENPDTAPSIPLNRAQSVRTHRRTRSEQGDEAGATVPATPASAATVVGQMYRGRGVVGGGPGGPMGPMSPTMTTMGPGSRQSVLSGMSTASHRTASLSSQRNAHRLSGGSDSVRSDSDPAGGSGDTSSMTGATSSSPRSSSGMTNYTGAVMTQNKLRPLRLVQESNDAMRMEEEEEMARKKANRSSWIPWFNQ